MQTAEAKEKKYGKKVRPLAASIDAPF